ncbi:response regulator transcription factor [Ruania alba]|uniref:DNA-binding response regulator, NarL/FixJ family, contains REC and HTH domains n=1 Tax=Ruania alba TaxID=648782 RepID=A0A1H5N1R9_9MICO|nr:response regulator transcription factor [Ruania alba]SEE95549.1 DNA-binding response regulator, NarL/FixJ family, contains REC and HTH domains [Ruania alba]
MDRRHRILIVDDDAMVRAGLRLMLRSATDIEVVAEATDGDEVVAAVQAHHPDVVLMDLRMSRMDGIAATRAVLALPSPPHVISLTTWDVSEAVLRSIDAGAAGFLLKTGSPEEIMRAVRAVVAGDAVLSPRSTRQVLDQLTTDGGAARAYARDLMSALTERERDVTVGVARGLSNAEVAHQLYVSEATVKSHLASAQAKLDVRNRVGVAVLAERAGLLAD